MTTFNQESSPFNMPVSTLPTPFTADKINVERSGFRLTYLYMSLALLLTAAVAFLSVQLNLIPHFVQLTSYWGLIGVIIIQFVLVFGLSAAIMKYSTRLALTIFAVYCAITGFVFSTIFYTYDLGSIALVFVLCAVFFAALTMFSLTTKINMLKFGGILFAALITLVIAQIVISFVAPSDMNLRIISTIGIIIFSGLTMYDTQKIRALLTQYEHNPDTIQRVAILGAFTLYLDFINMFLYLLRLLGKEQ